MEYLRWRKGDDLEYGMRIPLSRIPNKETVWLSMAEQYRFSSLSNQFSLLDRNLLLIYLQKENVVNFFLQINRKSLYHRLSPEIEDNIKNISLHRSSIDEFRLCQKYRNLFYDGISSTENFCSFLEEICSDIHQKKMTFRNTEVIARPNQNGEFIVYPGKEFIIEGINNCIRIIQARKKLGFLLASMSLMGIFLNIHPFRDGNGRTSRILFNIFLMNYVNRNIFIPISEISSVSNKGFILSIKEGQIFNNWSPIMKLINNYINEFLNINKKTNYNFFE